jgi:hypothetical protein
MPFAAMTPVIVTHRFFGRSIADLVMDIQRIKTALLRATLDNAYLANNPRVEVAETVRLARNAGRSAGVAPRRHRADPPARRLDVAAGSDHRRACLPDHRIHGFDQGNPHRRYQAGQGLDANALQNQSATAANQLFTAAQARMKMIARIFAETGIRDLFALIHATIRKHGQEAATVRLRNQWITVDPREWKTRNDMTIHVGLGTGGKQEQAALAMSILNIQEEDGRRRQVQHRRTSRSTTPRWPS